ncbi:hypothetical protein BDV29DRAFT_182472 [Aspergillus leporis]|uniref:Uncharacterized protein n=1 Tax=Aspergillus leporis TaxID=41062 RepID=A0A5N5WQZ7_9EURO|nr:hypothetical protein BDV29DRAFT_182472 [Aspergillus leporis]
MNLLFHLSALIIKAIDNISIPIIITILVFCRAHMQQESLESPYSRLPLATKVGQGQSARDTMKPWYCICNSIVFLHYRQLQVSATYLIHKYST